MSGSGFENRLAKNARHFLKWAKRRGLEAFRVYDLDMPDVPVAVDLYAGRAHVLEYPRRRAVKSGEAAAMRAEVVEAVKKVLQPSEVFVKTHAASTAQYEKQGSRGVVFPVLENGLKFEVNLSDYLDTGLFLDHRDTRARVRDEAKGKRFLNLFAYTGSFTVYAAAGGAAATTTVDLSNTYCDWAERNLALNGLPKGEVVRADVLRWLTRAIGPFDLVVLDPPSFSVSKKMERGWDVQRDHPALLKQVLALLAPNGVLYFSTNLTTFELDASIDGALPLKSIPEDFRRPVHRCWRFVR